MHTAWNCGRARATIDDAILGAYCITRGQRCLPTWSVRNTFGWFAGEVVIAIGWLSNSVVASNDNVCRQRIASTIGAIGIAGRARVDASGRIESDLGRGNGSRGGEEDQRVDHIDFGFWSKYIRLIDG